MDELDLEGNGDGYSGTFRWKASKKLPSLPARTTKGGREQVSTESWQEFFMSRCSTPQEAVELMNMVRQDMSLIDSLSSPMSICKIFAQLKLPFSSSKVPLEGSDITIVCIGCANKAEERILNETRCWSELYEYFTFVKTITVWLVGPEISTTKEKVIKESTRSKQLFQCNLFRGTAIEFFRARPSLMCKSTMVVGLNCGFGNFDNPFPKKYDLLKSWLPDLYFLTGTAMPLLFTCANDYADLTGEVSIMHSVMGANFICLPSENSFSFASTMIPPGKAQDDGEYARGNSFYYAVQGHDKSRRRKVALNDLGAAKAFHKTMKPYGVDELKTVSAQMDLQWARSAVTAAAAAATAAASPTTSNTTATATANIAQESRQDSSIGSNNKDSTSTIVTTEDVVAKMAAVIAAESEMEENDGFDPKDQIARYIQAMEEAYSAHTSKANSPVRDDISITGKGNSGINRTGSDMDVSGSTSNKESNNMRELLEEAVKWAVTGDDDDDDKSAIQEERKAGQEEEEEESGGGKVANGYSYSGDSPMRIADVGTNDTYGSSMRADADKSSDMSMFIESEQEQVDKDNFSSSCTGEGDLICVTQRVENKVLLAVISLSSICFASGTVINLKQIDLSLSEDGKEMCLSFMATSSSATIADRFTKLVALSAAVQPDTMVAKYSKKKNTLSLSAQVVP